MDLFVDSVDKLQTYYEKPDSRKFGEIVCYPKCKLVSPTVVRSTERPTQFIWICKYISFIAKKSSVVLQRLNALGGVNFEISSLKTKGNMLKETPQSPSEDDGSQI